MKLTVMGLGYIGLPTSIMFAKHEVEVVGVDVKKEVVDSLNSGKIHIEEPGLQEALEEVREKNLFKASLEPETSDAFIIAVPTPNFDDEYKSMNPAHVIDAVNSVIPYLEKGNVVIVESTISPRTTEDIVQPLLEDAGFTVGEDVYLVHCPERVLPGQIMHELIHNNRIVGGVSTACTKAGVRVYGTFVKGELIETNAKTAEMSKLMENTFRDVNIALANELTKVSNELEIDALEVIEMANKHPRVNLHTPGPGVGGHCLAVDPYFIVSKAPETANLIHLSRNINKSMPRYVVENIKKLMEQVHGKVVTLFGLAYKGNVDDTRESPAIEIYEMLKKETDFEVRVYDPHVENELVEPKLEGALANSELVVILTDHNEFKEMDIEKLNLMNSKRVLDTKNIVINRNDDFVYINFGNLYQYIKKEKVLV